MKKSRRGRKPMHAEGALSQRVELRVLPSEKEGYAEEAKLQGFASVNQWARTVLKRELLKRKPARR